MSELFPETIETDRLRLERLEADSVDVFELYRVFSSDADLEAVMRYVPLDPFETPHDALEMVSTAEESRSADEAATYVVRPRDGEDGAGEIAGTTTAFVDWERRTAEFAILLRERFWGREYSGERAAAFVDLAFDRFDLEVVAVSCLRENDRSRRAIEKYVEAHGGQYDGLFRNHRTIGDEPADLHRYTITESDYVAAGKSESHARQRP